MIRQATKNDMKEIMTIINEIKEDMKKENNPQWNDTYPLEEDFLEDIKKNALYVLEEEKIVAFASILESPKEEYSEIKNRYLEKSYTIHRLAVNKKYRKSGYAKKIFQFAENFALENNAYCLKGDTEIHNEKMNKLFEKLGYQQKGIIKWSDNDGTYNYYEKKLGSD